MSFRKVLTSLAIFCVAVGAVFAVIAGPSALRADDQAEAAKDVQKKDRRKDRETEEVKLKFLDMERKLVEQQAVIEKLTAELKSQQLARSASEDKARAMAARAEQALKEALQQRELAQRHELEQRKVREVEARAREIAELQRQKALEAQELAELARREAEERHERAIHEREQHEHAYDDHEHGYHDHEHGTHEHENEWDDHEDAEAEWLERHALELEIEEDRLELIQQRVELLSHPVGATIIALDHARELFEDEPEAMIDFLHHTRERARHPGQRTMLQLELVEWHRRIGHREAARELLIDLMAGSHPRRPTRSDRIPYYDEERTRDTDEDSDVGEAEAVE